MANVNLTTERSPVDSSKYARSGGITMVFFALILAVAGYVGLMLYGNYLTQSIDATKLAYDEEFQNILSGNAKEIFDFKSRMDLANELLSQDRNIPENFSEIEKRIIPNSHLTGYKFDDKTGLITLSGGADNYNTIAKQILSFKESDYFSGVTGGKTGVNLSEGSQGGLIFEINLTLK